MMGVFDDVDIERVYYLAKIVVVVEAVIVVEVKIVENVGE